MRLGVLAVVVMVAAVSVDAASPPPPRPERYDVACALKSLRQLRPTTVDVSWLMAAHEARRLAETGEVMVVDVRQAEQPEVPGTVRMPLGRLGSSPLLRGKRVGVLTDGYGYVAAVRACHKLAKPRASCIRGGIRGWLAAGGTTVGDRRGMWRIPPASLFGDRNLEEVAVVEVHEGKEAEVPGAMVLPVRSKPEQVAKVVADLAGRPGKLYVVVVCAEGLERELQRRFEGLTTPVFFLEGGVGAYERWSRRQVAQWQAQKAPRVVPGCPTCR